MYNSSIRIVMKKAFIVIIAAVATIACTKETNIQDKNLVLDGGLLSIEATISPFVDDATKASIGINGENGAITGAFSWSEGDQIAFPVTASGSPTYVALTYNTETKRFEGNLEDGQEVNYSGTIYYPASVVIGPTYSTSFASIDAAKAGFKMTAPVPSSLSQKVTMTHQSALVHVQFTNVPDFADKLVVSDGSDVATISTGSVSGTIHFYVPITPVNNKTYTFSLKDRADNVIKAVVSDSKTLEAGKYYNAPNVTIGPTILVKSNVVEEWNGIGSGCWWDGSLALHTWNGSYSTTWSEQNFKSFTIAEEQYFWFVYPEECDGQEMDVVIHRPNYDYPRLTTKIVPIGETSYTFGFATGLKRPADKFMHIAFSNDKRGYVYAWKLNDDSVKPFGAWKSDSYLQKVRMWNNDTTPRESFIFNVH